MRILAYGLVNALRARSAKNLEDDFSLGDPRQSLLTPFDKDFSAQGAVASMRGLGAGGASVAEARGATRAHASPMRILGTP